MRLAALAYLGTLGIVIVGLGAYVVRHPERLLGQEPKAAPAVAAAPETTAPAPLTAADQERERQRRADANTAEDKANEALRIVQAEGVVREKLKDPDSAQFRNAFFHRSGDGVAAICGEVNARNSFGGYTGFERFVSTGSAATSFLESEVEDMDAVWFGLCVSSEPLRKKAANAGKPPTPKHVKPKSTAIPAAMAKCNCAAGDTFCAAQCTGKR